MDWIYQVTGLGEDVFPFWNVYGTPPNKCPHCIQTGPSLHIGYFVFRWASICKCAQQRFLLCFKFLESLSKNFDQFPKGQTAGTAVGLANVTCTTGCLPECHVRVAFSPKCLIKRSQLVFSGQSHISQRTSDLHKAKARSPGKRAWSKHFRMRDPGHKGHQE